MKISYCAKLSDQMSHLVHSPIHPIIVHCNSSIYYRMLEMKSFFLLPLCSFSYSSMILRGLVEQRDFDVCTKSLQQHFSFFISLQEFHIPPNSCSHVTTACGEEIVAGARCDGDDYCCQLIHMRKAEDLSHLSSCVPATSSAHFRCWDPKIVLRGLWIHS